MNLLNKKILFIAPVFFNYEVEIQLKLEELGAIVDFFPDRPFNSSLLKALTRVFRPFTSIYANFCYKKIFKNLEISNYDYIFVIQGESLTLSTLKLLKKKYNSAIFILYMWDSFKNKKYLIENINLYEKKFSFDRADCKQYNMTFRPLFYSNALEIVKSITSYDLYFIGTIHSDRLTIINSVDNLLKCENRFYKYFYLQAPWVFFFRKIFNKEFMKEKYNNFHYVPLSKREISEVACGSVAVLDIEHPLQSGLTMRTFEALGAGNKLVTTNKNIVDYEFYDPNWIHIIDRANPEKTPFPENFFSFNGNFFKLSKFSNYSLDAWIADIFN